jgi:23S rRNA (guanosine2251-2'-O)-methyltransferase
MFVIGRNPVLESLKFNPQAIRKIVLIESISDNKIKEIIRIAGKNKIFIEKKLKKDFEQILDKKDKSEGVSQGVIAEVEEFKYAEFQQLLEKTKTKTNALILILDEIQDPHNLGAVIRTSAAAAIDGIIITEKNSAKVNHTVVKTSAGAVNYIDIVQSRNIYKSIETLKEKGFTVLGTSLKAAKTIYEVNFRGKFAVILGNEGEGIRKNIVKLCDEQLKIPIADKVESLNVSVSAGIILYEVLRQSKSK